MAEKETERVVKMGIDLFLMFRLLKNQTTQDAKMLLYQTEHTLGKSRENENVATKSGNIPVPKDIEYDFSFTSLVADGDPVADEIEEAFDKNETLEVWEVDRASKNEEGKYKAEYFQVKVTEFSKTPNSEDQLELEITLQVSGKGQKGFATLTEEQEEVLQYVFEDTVKKPAEG